MRYRRMSYRYTTVGALGQVWSVRRIPGRAIACAFWLRHAGGPMPTPTRPRDASRSWSNSRASTRTTSRCSFSRTRSSSRVSAGFPRARTPAVYHTAGIRQGPFRVDLPLPAPVDPERVEARYDRGLLRITLAKRGEAALMAAEAGAPADFNDSRCAPGPAVARHGRFPLTMFPLAVDSRSRQARRRRDARQPAAGPGGAAQPTVEPAGPETSTAWGPQP